MFYQLQKSPSLYKHAVHNSVFKNALTNARKEIVRIRLLIKSELQEVTNNIHDNEENKDQINSFTGNHQNLLLLTKHEQQLRQYVMTLLRKKSLIMKQIAVRELVLSR